MKMLVTCTMALACALAACNSPVTGKTAAGGRAGLGYGIGTTHRTESDKMSTGENEPVSVPQRDQELMHSTENPMAQPDEAGHDTMMDKMLANGIVEMEEMESMLSDDDMEDMKEPMMNVMMTAMMEGMYQRHSAPIPADYAGLHNPVAAGSASLARGQEIYSENCEICHGVSGMGDGPDGAQLSPGPAPIRISGQMLSDEYLFWRISEGGEVFDTAMPTWKRILDERQRWDVINYVRALGR